jgi:NAD(P)-dependent dehydrogenase (short-subunit alcohol dehydrogenase family)
LLNAQSEPGRGRTSTAPPRQAGTREAGTREARRGGRLEPLVADLSTSAGIEALLSRAAELEVELLVNNAGVASYGADTSRGCASTT